jgi:hypothetical protein
MSLPPARGPRKSRRLAVGTDARSALLMVGRQCPDPPIGRCTPSVTTGVNCFAPGSRSASLPVGVAQRADRDDRPAGDHSHIFERFWRADHVRPREAGGSGLGLTIARQIADQHNARLDVQSDAGGGSVFTISFAKAGRRVTAQPAGAPEGSEPTPSTSCLNRHELVAVAEDACLTLFLDPAELDAHPLADVQLIERRIHNLRGHLDAVV